MTRGVSRIGVLVCATLMSAMMAPAWAQSGTGVTAALVGDIARSNGSSEDPRRPGDGNGSTFSLRVDRALGSRWGVELEYVHGAEFETEMYNRALILPEGLPFDASATSILAAGRTRYQVRRSTITPMLWYRQSLGGRTSLIYSAGMGFVVLKSETTYAYSALPNQNTIPPIRTTYTSYGINPVVGVDARIGMTDRLSVVPGVRLLAGDGGFLLRPAVGVRWEF